MNENNHDSPKVQTGRSAWGRFWSRLVAEPEQTIAHRLYEVLVKHARLAVYYQKLDVPDTPEGRFEILALHVGLTVRRLFSLGPPGRQTGQELFDLMVADLDVNLRELGVGDLSVGKQVKRLAGQFYARLAALNEAFDDGRLETLSPALATNVYGTTPSSPDQVASLVDILVALKEAMDDQSSDDLMEGRITLPDERALLTLIDKRLDAHVGSHEDSPVK